MTAGRASPAGPNPHDTPLSAISRFLVELVAWIAGPWSAVELTGAVWVAVLVLAALLLLPARFNVPGDKHLTGVAVSGPVRMGIEALLGTVAVVGSWVLWVWPVALAVTVAAIVMVVAGRHRYRWMVAQDGS